MKYKVIVQEILEREVEVEADTENEALTTVSNMHMNSEIVLNYSDLEDINFIIVDQINQ